MPRRGFDLARGFDVEPIPDSAIHREPALCCRPRAVRGSWPSAQMPC